MDTSFAKQIKKLSHPYRKELASSFKIDNVSFGPKKSVIRGISISDLHVPYQREDVIEFIVKNFKGADYCVVNGDLLDLSLISKFTKSREIPISLEYHLAQKTVDYLAANFKQVFLVDGNHEARMGNALNKIDSSARFLFKTSPLKYIADGIRFDIHGELEEETDPPSNVHYVGDWFFQIGKTIFAHRLRGYKSGPMQNACWLTEHFIDRGFDFQCLISGHSHHLGSAYHMNKLTIDQGCLCMPQDYEVQGGRKYVPTSVGFAYVEMDAEGNVDTTKTQPIYLGSYTQKDCNLQNRWSVSDVKGE